MKQKKPAIAVPSGFLEYTSEEAILYDQVRSLILERYAVWGYPPIYTPMVERSEVIQAKGGDEIQSQTFGLDRLSRKDSNLELGRLPKLAMRPDHTIPLAAHVARNHGKLVFPFKRAASGSVMRGERAQAGRFCQFEHDNGEEQGGFRGDCCADKSEDTPIITGSDN